MHIDCKGYLVRGPHKPAVVVVTKQGLLAQGKDSEDLVPAGIGELQEGGSPVAPSGNAGQAKLNRPDPNDTYRTRVIVLLDISSSMSGGKLSTVQDKIQSLSSGLQKQGATDVEYIVIPYDDKIYPSCKTKSPKELISFIQKQHPSGSTDIAKAINEGLSTIDRNKQSEARNIILLITDGQHNCSDTNNVFTEAAKALDHDSSIYCIGVGSDYDLDLLKKVLGEAKFGGLAHISENRGAKNPVEVFGEIIPEFIAQVRTAPNYPIVSFNSSFTSAHNLNPSIREVIQEKYERELLSILDSKGIVVNGTTNYPSRCGYQLVNFSLGFIENPDDGKVVFYVKPQGNSKQMLEAKELDIIPLEDAVGLDPNERTLIESAPKLIEFDKVVTSRDKALIEDFLKRFDGKLKQEELDLAKELLERLNNPYFDHVDEGHTRDSMSQVGSMFSGDTVMSFGHTVTFENPIDRPTMNLNPADLLSLKNLLHPNQPQGEQVNDLSIIPPQDVSFSPPPNNPAPDDPGLHSGYAGDLFNPNTVGSLPVINGPADVNPQAYDQDQIRLNIVFTNIAQPNLSVDISDNTEIGIGRHPANAIVINSGNASRYHSKIIKIGNQLFLLDNNSRNGTYLNRVKLGSNPELENIITSGDLIKVANIEFRINF